ncbi:hypothetical protein MKX01_035768 [Papaver californicum]|nr:hypothetical protein MKX01_035768 [Papaver californicum]
MAQRTLNHHRQTLESFTYQLHTWKPFQFQTLTKPLTESHKRPCLSDRTRTTTTTTIDTLEMSKLSIIEDEKRPKKKEKFQWFASAKKRRRHGSRSVSGRSTSDRSGTRRCCSVGASAAHATCSDFVVAATNTDSSGELFVNGGGGNGGEGNWSSSDVSEVKNSRKDKKDCGGGSGGTCDKGESLSSAGVWQIGGFDNQGNESGYGSEPGYRGDAEFGYGDEFDEEEDDGRVLFWGEKSRDTDCNMEMVEENTFSDQKSHYRCRRKKHDWRMAVDPPR